MTEMQLYGQPNELVAPANPMPATTFADQIITLAQAAEVICKTQMVPRALQGKPAEITALWLAADELGIPRWVALREVHVIDGKPTLSANLMRSMATAKGVKFRVVESSDTRVLMEARAPGDEQWTPSDWPIERARKMGLTNKSNWQKMPQSMLLARATSELCRLVASMTVYSTEEFRDTETPADPAPPLPKRRRGATIKATVYDEPPLEPTEPDAPEPDGVVIGHAPEPEPAAEQPPDGGDKITDTTRKAIMAGFGELNITDRAVRLEKVSTVLGREVPSVNTLTEEEGRRVVAKLQEIRANWPPVTEPPL